MEVIQLKNLLDEDFSNYKQPSMFIGFPKCNFKCERDAGVKMCQNSSLALAPNIDVSIKSLYERFVNNPLTKAIVCGGLEPLDTFEELCSLIKYFRDNDNDTKFVVYTGYCPEEVFDKIARLSQFGNIIVKFGRFIPNDESVFDTVLGIKLASKNQYAVEL